MCNICVRWIRCAYVSSVSYVTDVPKPHRHPGAFITDSNLIRSNKDNIIKKTMYIINKFQTKQTTNLLTNNYINIKFINNKLIIIKNPSNIDITKLLTKNFITYKQI